MAQRGDLAGLVVRAGAGFHRHQSSRLARQIEPDCANLTHGRLLCSGVFNTSTLALRCRQGASVPSLWVELGHRLAAINRTFGDLPETGLHE
jgi:hypothetical protein